MRVLILSSILACVAAAPSELVAPIIKSEILAPVAAVPVAGVPVAKLATVDPGDVEAAAINAKVAADDAAIAAADKARLLSELAVVDVKDQTQVVNDQVKEKQEEAFWSVEDQKWRYLDAVNTAEAKLDGAIARDASILARSTLGGVVVAPAAPIVAPAAPIVAPTARIVAPTAPIVAPTAPIIAPTAPIVAPILASRTSLVAPILYSAPAILKTEEKKDEKMDDKMKIDENWGTIVKSAEMLNEELKIKMAALEKNLEAKPGIFAPTLWSAPIVAPYKLTEPWLTQVYVPGAAYSSLHGLTSPLLASPVKVA